MAEDESSSRSGAVLSTTNGGGVFFSAASRGMMSGRSIPIIVQDKAKVNHTIFLSIDEKPLDDGTLDC
jgi:hypothetical protein